jgi:hypothetical protein
LANVFVPNPTATQARSLKLGESLSAGAFMAAVAGLTSQFGASANNLQASGAMLLGGLGAFTLVYTDFRLFRRGDAEGAGAIAGAAPLLAPPAAAWPGNAIFISYRRVEWALAGRIRDGLNARFGGPSVYFDGDDTKGKWKGSITEALSRARVLVAVIGPQWETLLNERAGRAQRDEVFDEIDAALTRGITVIPVIVGDDTPLPDKTRVAERLHSFYDRLSAWQYRSLKRATWDYEFGVIVDDITASLEASAKSGLPPADA